MENKIEIFKNEELGEVRSLTINGEPWFVAGDIAKCLGYSELRKMYEIVEDYEKMEINPQSVDFTGLLQNGATQSKPNENIKRMILVNESGLYNAIFSSKLSSAKKFKHWVTSEVLPSIRKHGLYITEELLKDKEKLQREIDKIQNEYYELEHKINDAELDNNILKAEKAELKERNIKMYQERESAFKLSLKTHEKETYLPNLTIQAIRHYINNNENVILDEDEEGFYIKLSSLVKELKKLILNNGDRLYVLCSLGINISDRVTFIPRKFMNEDYEVTGISYM
jgi:prophage antirepressor-like protein